ncbi:hypothetical protein L3Q82_026215 [Scortum barcoo]|uniref:Uncharacterized protein n=1 Tax=Scortum barcoo TaxID=214431 RepID=A0ACB8WIJ8_9TELE|nr:hypothetical protein L3Q82_026215 [Scortum barcoo]
MVTSVTPVTPTPDPETSASSAAHQSLVLEHQNQDGESSPGTSRGSLTGGIPHLGRDPSRRSKKPPPLHTGADWKVVLHLPEIETWLRATSDRVTQLTHSVGQDSDNRHVDVHLVQLKVEKHLPAVFVGQLFKSPLPSCIKSSIALYLYLKATPKLAHVLLTALISPSLHPKNSLNLSDTFGLESALTWSSRPTTHKFRAKGYSCCYTHCCNYDQDVCEDISDHVEQIHALLETEFSLKLLSYSVNIIVDIRTVQLLWHQLRVSVLVLKERLLQGLQDSNGNYTRQTDILQAFSEDQHQTRLDALTEVDDCGQLTIRCSQDYFSLDCGITAFELSDYSPGDEPEARETEPDGKDPSQELEQSRGPNPDPEEVEGSSLSNHEHHSSLPELTTPGDSTNHNLSPSILPTMQCGMPNHSDSAKRPLPGVSHSTEVSPTQPSLPKRAALFSDGGASMEDSRGRLGKVGPLSRLQLQAEMSRSTPSLMDPPDRSKFWLELDSVYPENVSQSYESLQGVDPWITSDWVMNGRNLQRSHVSSRQWGAQKTLTNQRSSSGARPTTDAPLPLQDSVPQDEMSKQMERTQKETHVHGEGDSDSSLPSPMREQFLSSDLEASGEESDPRPPPGKTAVWIVKRQGQKGTQISSKSSPNREHWYGSEEFLALPAQLRKTEMLATKLESLAQSIPLRPADCDSTQEALQDVDDWDLTELNPDWDLGESGDDFPSPLPPLLPYRRNLVSRFSSTSSSDIAPSLDESIESGPLSDLQSEEDEGRRSAGRPPLLTAPPVEVRGTASLVQQLLEDIQSQDKDPDVWRKIECFVQQLDGFILWLQEALDSTENWTQPRQELDSLRVYLDTHLAFAVRSSAVPVPHRDAAGQDALDDGGVGCSLSPLRHHRLPQSPQEVQPLMSLLDQLGDVECPGEVITDVDAQELEAADKLHLRVSDHQRDHRYLLTPVKAALEDTFKLNVDSHVALKESIMEEGRALLSVITSHQSVYPYVSRPAGLKDILHMVSSQWDQLQRQIRRQHGWMLRALRCIQARLLYAGQSHEPFAASGDLSANRQAPCPAGRPQEREGEKFPVCVCVEPAGSSFQFADRVETEEGKESEGSLLCFAGDSLAAELISGQCEVQRAALEQMAVKLSSLQYPSSTIIRRHYTQLARNNRNRITAIIQLNNLSLSPSVSLSLAVFSLQEFEAEYQELWDWLMDMDAMVTDSHQLMMSEEQRHHLFKGKPCRSPTCTGNRSDLLPAMRTKLLLRSYRDRTALSKGSPDPILAWSTPTEYHEGHGRMPSPDPQSTCGLVGQTPINPQAPCGGYRAGPVFHDQDENRIVPPESEGRPLSAEFSSPVPWRGDLPGEAEKCDPPVVGTHSPVPLFKKRDHHPSLPHQRHCPQPPCNVAKACQPRQPHNIQRFEVLRADLIHPRRLATMRGAYVNYLSDFGLGDGRVHLRDPSLRFLIGRQAVGGIEEILEVFLPPSDNVPSRGQQLPTCTVNSVGRVLLPPSEAPDGLPESLRGNLRPTDSPPPWPHRTPPRPEFLPPGPSWAAACLAWPAGTCQLRQESHRPTCLSTMEAENMVHSDSMSPASLGICEKLFRRWELKTSLTEGSARRSQQTLTIRLFRLGLPGLSNFLLCQRIQLTTRCLTLKEPHMGDEEAERGTRHQRDYGGESQQLQVPPVHISEDLTWTHHTDFITKSARQRLFFLRRLRRLNMDSKILCSFYRCTIERILTGCITAWYSSCTALNRKALQREVKAAQRRTPVTQLQAVLPAAVWPTSSHAELVMMESRKTSLLGRAESLKRSGTELPGDFHRKIHNLTHTWRQLEELSPGTFRGAFPPQGHYFTPQKVPARGVDTFQKKILSEHSGPSQQNQSANVNSLLVGGGGVAVENPRSALSPLTNSLLEQLEARIKELKAWLRDTELLIFNSCLRQDKDAAEQLQNFKSLCSEVRVRRRGVSSVLKLCQKLLQQSQDDNGLHNSDKTVSAILAPPRQSGPMAEVGPEAEQHREALQLLSINLERRWEAIVMQALQWQNRLKRELGEQQVPGNFLEPGLIDLHQISPVPAGPVAPAPDDSWEWDETDMTITEPEPLEAPEPDLMHNLPTEPNMPSDSVLSNGNQPDRSGSGVRASPELTSSTRVGSSSEVQPSVMSYTAPPNNNNIYQSLSKDSSFSSIESLPDILGDLMSNSHRGDRNAGCRFVESERKGGRGSGQSGDEEDQGDEEDDDEKKQRKDETVNGSQHKDTRKNREEEKRRRHRRGGGEAVQILINGHGILTPADSDSDFEFNGLETPPALSHRAASLESCLVPCRSAGEDTGGSLASLGELDLGKSREADGGEPGKLSRRTLDLLKRLENIQSPQGAKMTRSVSDMTLRSSSRKGPPNQRHLFLDPAAAANANASSYRKRCHGNSRGGQGMDEADAASLSLVVNVSCTSACTDEDEDDSDLLSSSTLTLTEEELGVRDGEDEEEERLSGTSSVNDDDEDDDEEEMEGSYVLGLEYMKRELQSWIRFPRTLSSSSSKTEAGLRDELRCGTNLSSTFTSSSQNKEQNCFLNRTSAKLIENNTTGGSNRTKRDKKEQEEEEENRRNATRSYISQFVDDVENGNVDQSCLKAKDEDDELLREESSVFTKKGESLRESYVFAKTGESLQDVSDLIAKTESNSTKQLSPPPSCELLPFPSKRASSLVGQLRGELPCHSSSVPSPPSLSPVEDCRSSNALHNNNNVRPADGGRKAITIQEKFKFSSFVTEETRREVRDKQSSLPPKKRHSSHSSCCSHLPPLSLRPCSVDEGEKANVHDFVMEIIDMTSVALKSKESQPEEVNQTDISGSIPDQAPASLAQIRDKRLWRGQSVLRGQELDSGAVQHPLVRHADTRPPQPESPELFTSTKQRVSPPPQSSKQLRSKNNLCALDLNSEDPQTDSNNAEETTSLSLSVPPSPDIRDEETLFAACTEEVYLGPPLCYSMVLTKKPRRLLLKEDVEYLSSLGPGYELNDSLAYPTCSKPNDSLRYLSQEGPNPKPGDSLSYLSPSKEKNQDHLYFQGFNPTEKTPSSSSSLLEPCYSSFSTSSASLQESGSKPGDDNPSTPPPVSSGGEEERRGEDPYLLSDVAGGEVVAAISVCSSATNPSKEPAATATRINPKINCSAMREADREEGERRGEVDAQRVKQEEETGRRGQSGSQREAKTAAEKQVLVRAEPLSGYECNEAGVHFTHFHF